MVNLEIEPMSGVRVEVTAGDSREMVSDQALFLDPLANSLGIVTTQARHWKIGRGGTGGVVNDQGSGATYQMERVNSVRLN